MDFSNKRIISLPIKFFNGDLNLWGCSLLKSLPDGLVVNGYLDCSECISLISLPERLHVRNDLNLRNTIFAKVYNANQIKAIIETKGGKVEGDIIM